MKEIYEKTNDMELTQHAELEIDKLLDQVNEEELRIQFTNKLDLDSKQRYSTKTQSWIIHFQ